MGAVDNVERVVAPAVASAGLELVDVELRPGAVKVTVDRAGGVDLDGLGAVTVAISNALDRDDVVPGGRYELEVSSPGVERRLRRPDHFRRFVGADVSVRTRPGVEGERRFDAVLEAADDEGIVVVQPGPDRGARRLSYLDLERVHTIFDWRAALAGTSAPSARAERRHGRKAASGTAARSGNGPGRDAARLAGVDREMTETR